VDSVHQGKDGSLAYCCEYSNESLSYVKCEEFLDQRS
jgi:hypothetical protein